MGGTLCVQTERPQYRSSGWSTRECSVGEGARCAQDLEVEARNLLATGRAQARTVLQVLGGTLKALTPIRGPKYVVLFSGGQAFDQELLIHYNEFAREAAAARIVLHTVHIDQPESDTANRSVISSGFGGRDMSSGLTTMAGMTGGVLRRRWQGGRRHGAHPY